jgi:hypothetical protein
VEVLVEKTTRNLADWRTAEAKVSRLNLIAIIIPKRISRTIKLRINEYLKKYLLMIGDDYEMFSIFNELMI